MKTSARARYAGYRFPSEIISHAVWLYFRFPLGLRMVEELLAARGIIVSHETVRQWARKFGQPFANQIRRRLPRVGDKWHLDEVVLKIAGAKHWLWRRRGPDRDRARCSGPTPTRQARGQAAVTQALEEADATATRHDYRQAGQLRRGQKRGHARHRASPAQGVEQQSGKLASADAPTRAPNEAVQIGRPGAAVPLRPRSNQQPLPSPPRS